MAATAVVAAVSMLPAPAAEAAPHPPNNPQDAVQQLRALTHQAEQLTEDWKQAQEEHARRQGDLDRANADMAAAQQAVDQARADEDRLRGRVDRFTDASFEGARLNKLSALLVSKSPHDFLDRSSALEMLARKNNEAVDQLAAARDQAETARGQAQSAQSRAARAAADAAHLEAETGQRKAQMDRQIKQVKSRLAQLTAQQRNELHGGGDSNYQDLPTGSGVGAAAAKAALSKQGSRYVWGAKGPNTFDCSGLVYWAYKQVGVSLPASSKAQARAGKSVSKSQLRPGDLVAYYHPVSHIGIYVGNGKVVQAPTSGDVVKVSNMDAIGTITAMRRVS